ncbi:MAG: hypothetical protein FJ146_06480 [Deltaproteobacteria bacterium]|nr:hypothetical protein [Deltaproteobacteria bacterium]
MQGSWINWWRRYRETKNAVITAVPGVPRSVASTRSETQRERRQAVVKDRPVSLEQRYTTLESSLQADEIFLRLKQNLYAALDAQEGGRTVFRESGRVAPGRPYFYLKPAGEKGWLWERQGAGWVITRAEKIIGRNLFLRDEEPVDAVELFVAKDRVAMPRVRSQSLGQDLLAMAVYEQKLRKQLAFF